MKECLEDIEKGQVICIRSISPYCKCHPCRSYKDRAYRKTERRKMKRDKQKGLHRKVC